MKPQWYTCVASSMWPKWPGQLLSFLPDGSLISSPSHVRHLMERSLDPMRGSLTLPYCGTPFAYAS
jgi:hypothetical protein